jgi:hypothetical protein
MMKKNRKPSGVCAWCERPIKTAVEADGKRYCQKLCAAQGLVDAEITEYGISGDIGELDVLFVESMLYEGPRRYGVKVRYCDGAEYLNFDDLDREDFSPMIVVIDDDKTPDWTPADLAQAIRDGRITRVTEGTVSAGTHPRNKNGRSNYPM